MARVLVVARRAAGESGFKLTLIMVLSMLSMKLPSKPRDIGEMACHCLLYQGRARGNRKKKDVAK